MAEPAPRRPFPFATALRESFRGGYGLAEFRRDALAGLVVAVIALPLSMALGIASGVRPENGLATAIVAGLVIALAGGSRLQVSGPTAAFVVILAPIVERHGVEGLLLATFLAGFILLGLGLARLGRAVTFIPFPVVAGFTAGIAIVIATIQVRDFLGLELASVPSGYLDKVATIAKALPSARWGDASIGILTVVTLLLWPRLTRKIPSALVAVGLATVAAIAAERWIPGFTAETIGRRFATADAPGGIPASLPRFHWPWSPHGEAMDLAKIRELVPAAFAIALLGAIESLLSAVVADGMARTRSDPDAELVGQGLGNLASPLFGGIAATGAIARTAANVRAGARSPVASAVHALTLLASLLALAPVLGKLPMAAMAGLLLVVAWNMGDFRHVLRAIRGSPRGDALVLVICLALTVLFDMVVATLVGVALAGILLMRRVADLSATRLVAPDTPDDGPPPPPGTVVYAIDGPLFFGAAQRAMHELERIADASGGVRTVVLELSGVPAIDATGLFHLESAVRTLAERRIRCVLAGAAPPVAETLGRSIPHWRCPPPELAADRPAALALAERA